MSSKTSNKNIKNMTKKSESTPKNSDDTRSINKKGDKKIIVDIFNKEKNIYSLDKDDFKDDKNVVVNVYYNYTDDDFCMKKPAKAKSKINKKDPAAPERGFSAYIFFCIRTRPIIKAKNPDMKGSEIITELAKSWKALSEDEKVPFQKLSLMDKDRYIEEMKSYNPSVNLMKAL